MGLSFQIYPPIKDTFLWLKRSKQDIKDMENSLAELVAKVLTIKKKMESIDQSLKDLYVFKEKSDDYDLVKREIQIITHKYDNFINKYQKYTEGIPSFAATLDRSNAERIIGELQERKPKILTHKFFELAELGRDMAKLEARASLLLEKISEDKLTVDRKQEVPLNLNAYDNLPVHLEYVKELMMHLHYPNSKVIGLVGPPSVGKTNVLRLLNNQLKDNTFLFGEKRLDFRMVITLPKELNNKEKIIETIQDRVMEKLKQNVLGSSDARESELSKFLDGKAFILLIDQICTDIDLNKLGLPKNGRWKVVLASHSQKVIGLMASKTVKMESLSMDHAMDLFKKIYGGEIAENLKYKAHGIIKCCGGLPQVIKLVATHLRNPHSSWDDVKRILQDDTEVEVLGLGAVCNAYKLVYENLPMLKDNIKICSLYGLVFPSEHLMHKDYLAECWMTEGLVNIDVEQRLRHSRARGDTLLNILTDSYLLLWCSDQHVKMPVYFRKLAFKENYMRMQNCLILETSKHGIQTNAERISAFTRDSEPTLLLERNLAMVTLHNSLVKHMGGLRVLDLNKTKINSLPKFISKLTKLVSLYLNNCSELTGLPNDLNKLKSLELFDIRGSSIRSLPEEIGELVGLRCLRVSFAYERKGKKTEEMIPFGIITKLKELEEFTIETCISNSRWNTIANRVAGELADLEKLNTLNFHFPSISSLKTFVTKSKSWKNMKTSWLEDTFRSFNFSVGSHDWRHPYDSDIYATEKQLRFCTSEENCMDNDFESVKDVLKQAEAFELCGHVGVQSLNDFGLENASSLKVLIVERCDNVKRIFGEEIAAAFKSLKMLQFYNLNSLQSILRESAPIPQGCFSKLEVLTLCGCLELTEVMNHELAKALSSLKTLKVENCPELVKIVSNDMPQQDDPTNDALQKLETLELKNLPKLQSIIRAGTSMKWGSLRKVVIERCSELRDFSSTILRGAKKVERIMCESHWWEELVLEGETKEYFQSRGIIVTLESSSVVAGGEGEPSLSERSVNYFEESADNNDSQTTNGGNMFGKWRFYYLIVILCIMCLLGFCLWMVRGERKEAAAG